MTQVYFCVDDADGDAETFGDCIVWAKATLATQIVANIENIRILFLILKLIEAEN